MGCGKFGKFSKKDIIKKSFLICGISNNLDGSEDDLFEGYKKN